jgi:hypothetical protein
MHDLGGTCQSPQPRQPGDLSLTAQGGEVDELDRRLDQRP